MVDRWDHRCRCRRSHPHNRTLVTLKPQGPYKLRKIVNTLRQVSPNLVSSKYSDQVSDDVHVTDHQKKTGYINLNTSQFSTNREWASVESTTLRHLSIGEEQSGSDAVNVAWSPSCLAVHHRSILAVLTSNLLLSIWTPGHNVHDESAWKRVAIVNKMIRERLQNPSMKTKADNALRLRIRAFAWAPCSVRENMEPVSVDSVQWPQLLAIGNDLGEVMILWILSPFEGFSQWDVRVLSTLNVADRFNSGSGILSRASLLGEKMDSSPLISHLNWGKSWQRENAGGTQVWRIAFSIDCKAQSLPITICLRLLCSANAQSIPFIIIDDPFSTPGPPFTVENSLVHNSLFLSERYPTIAADLKKMGRRDDKSGETDDEVVVKVWTTAVHPVHETQIAALVSLHPPRVLEYLSSHSASFYVVTGKQNTRSTVQHDPSLSSEADLDSSKLRDRVKADLREYDQMVSWTSEQDGSQNWDRRIRNAIFADPMPRSASREDEACDFWETCIICHSDIPFTSVKEARCGDGHQFGECFRTWRKYPLSVP